MTTDPIRRFSTAVPATWAMLLALAMGGRANAAEPPPVPQPADDQYVRAAGTQTSVVPPPLARVRRTDRGFTMHGEDGAMWGQVVIGQLLVGFDGKKASFIATAKRHMSTDARVTEFELPGRQQGVLVAGKNAPPGPNEVLAVTCLVGTGESSVSVQCLYLSQAIPQRSRGEFADQVRVMLTTVRFDPSQKVDLLEGLTYSFSLPAGLKPAYRFFDLVLLTPDGRMPPRDGTAPNLVVSLSGPAVPPEQRKDQKFLESEIRAQVDYADTEIKEIGPLKRDDGGTGWEAVFEARQADGKERVVVYFARVFVDDDTLVYTFNSDPKSAAALLPAVKAAARSIRLKPSEPDVPARRTERTTEQSPAKPAPTETKQ